MTRFPVKCSTAGRVVHAGTCLALTVVSGCGSSSAGPDTGAAAGVGGQVSAGGSQGGASTAGGAPASGGTSGASGVGTTAGVSATGGGGQGPGLGGASGDGGATQLGGAGPGGGFGGAAGGAGAASGSGGVASDDLGKVTLFDGTGLSKWRSKDGGGSAPWTATSDYFTVVPNSGDITTRESFGDIALHVEFWIPSTPVSNSEQDRGNSGIYLQGRYEVQVLDSYDHPLDGANDCGAIYELKNADVNASLPPGSWQTYDIIFHAPRWVGDQKTANARISVTWNGQTAQSEVEVPAPTRLGDAEAPGDGPLRLQDHSHAVRYRNLWLRHL